jgi:hypothetical protein
MFDTDSVINQTGLQVNVAWSAAPGAGTGSYSTRGYKMEGPARLNFIKDTNRLDMTIDFQVVAGPFGEHTPPTTGINHYTGTIDGNGSARGTLVDSKGVSDGWTIDRGFQCVAAPAAPPPPAPEAVPVVPPPAAPVQCPSGSTTPTVPAGQSCTAAVVTDAIALSFGPPNLGNITATVRNSSDLTGNCTYDATGLADTHRDFTVGPKVSTTLSFNGFNTGTTYHATVSCMDASGKQTQPIGTDSKDVKF